MVSTLSMGNLGGSKTKSLTRPSPSESATLFSVGTEKKGNDENMYIIKVNKNGVNRWVKINGEQSNQKEKIETTVFIEFKPKSKKDKDYNLSSDVYLQNSIH